jgi:hypothetical protein
MSDLRRSKVSPRLTLQQDDRIFYAQGFNDAFGRFIETIRYADISHQMCIREMELDIIL